MQGRSRCASMDEVLSSRYDLVINKVREQTDAGFRLSSAEAVRYSGYSGEVESMVKVNVWPAGLTAVQV